MQRSLNRIVVFVLLFCLTFSLCFRRLKVDAFVLEVVGGSAFLELVVSLGVTIGTTYLFVDGLTQEQEDALAADIYAEILNKAAAAGIDTSDTEAVEDYICDEVYNLGYYSYIGGEMVYLGGGESPDPDEPEEPDDPEEPKGGKWETVKRYARDGSLFVSVPLVGFLGGLYSDIFSGKDSDSVLSPTYVPKNWINYADADGFIRHLNFGNAPYYEGMENVLSAKVTSLNVDMMEGRIVSSVINTTDTHPVRGFMTRFIIRNPVLHPIVVLEENKMYGSDFPLVSMRQYDERYFLGLFSGTKGSYPQWRSSAYAFGYDTVVYTNTSWSEASANEASFVSPKESFEMWVTVPDTMIIDTVAGLAYHYGESGLVRREYDASGNYAEYAMDGGYLMNSDGTYQGLKDIYPETNADEFILQRLNELQDYIQTNYPAGEVPNVSKPDMEGVRTGIDDSQSAIIGDYPIREPDTQEVPATYPQEVDKLLEDMVGSPTEENPPASPAPSAAPGGDTGTKPPISSSKGDYALSLGDFFPFCIPRDLYWIVEGLAAEPRAPKFSIPFPYRDGDGVKTKELEIDLSEFDGVARMVRAAERIVFIAVLLFVSKRLVKGG